MASTNRDATIDIAKGIAIIAIVLGHVLRGLAMAGIIDSETTNYEVADRCLYMFHLSVFALMAGLFVQHALRRDGVAQYLRARSVSFLYLYLVWSMIQGGVKLVTASLVNTPTSIAGVMSIWRPEGQLWFFPFLIAMTTAVAVMGSWRSRLAIPLSLALATMLSLAAWGVNGPIAGTQGLGLTAFYFFGMVWGAKSFIMHLGRIRPKCAVVAVLVAGSSLFALVSLTDATPPTSGGENRTVITVSLGVIASCVGVLLVLALARLIVSFDRYARWLAFIGERSLEVFLAHIIAASGARIVLSRMGIYDPMVHIVAGMLAGVVLPLFLWWALERLRWPWLFEASSRLTGRPKKEDGIGQSSLAARF